MHVDGVHAEGRGAGASGGQASLGSLQIPSTTLPFLSQGVGVPAVGDSRDTTGSEPELGCTEQVGNGLSGEVVRVGGSLWAEGHRAELEPGGRQRAWSPRRPRGGWEHNFTSLQPWGL